jgi:hypothetical protein
MSNKANGVNWSKKASAKQRRVNVIARLEKQLLEGKKINKVGKALIPLLDKDIIRINKELSTLKQRV